MQKTTQSLQQAIEDLATIRRAVDKARHEDLDATKAANLAIGTNKTLQYLSVGIAIFFLIIELFFNNINTSLMIYSQGDLKFQVLGIVNTAIILLTLSSILYYVVYKASAESEKSFSKYVARNFVYLRNLSFLSDLLIKFSFFAALILAEKPQWVAPVFFLFLADYLIQGRFFTIGTAKSLILAIACIVAAIVQLALSSPFLSWPLAGAIIISAVSLYELSSASKQIASKEEIR